MAAVYVPERGDLVWLDFTARGDRKGHEQAGHRPALVISPRNYNRRVGLALFCPVISRAKGYPFEVLLPETLDITGAVLSDQIKSMDWKARKARRICSAPPDVVEEATGKILAIVDPG